MASRSIWRKLVRYSSSRSVVRLTNRFWAAFMVNPFLGLDSGAGLHLNTRITARRTSEFRIDLERSVAKRRAPGHYLFRAMRTPVFYSLVFPIKIWSCRQPAEVSARL